MPENATILLVDDTPANLHVLVDTLGDTGHNLMVATNGPQAIDRAREFQPDLVLLDVLMPGIDGFETCRRLKADPKTHDIPVIFMTALSDQADKLKGFESGGVDYVTKPIEHGEVMVRIETHLSLCRLRRDLAASNADLERRVTERTAELKSAMAEINTLKTQLELENVRLRQELSETQPYGDIVGTSPAVQAVTEMIEMVAPTNASVLIEGESGVGKELVARELHKRSKRASGPIVKVNCACVPHELYESEFFGHARGAFTGAVRSREGRFAAAHGGTLFLDEVGEIPLELQSKLLRVLQEGTYERVGESRTRTVDVRIVAATNRDLAQEVQAGRFRSDLYYRLNVFPLPVPPLRERGDDVVLLASYFVERLARKMGLGAPPPLREAELDPLLQYDWPGNIRELENVVEQALIRARLTGRLSFEHLQRRPSANPAPGGLPELLSGSLILTDAQLREMEKLNAKRALAKANGRIRGHNGAAALLGLPPTTLTSRLKRMGLK